MAGDDSVLGVEREIIEGFLTLFRDNYALARKATHYLESNERESNIHGITNMRDALSHLVNALDPDKNSKTARKNWRMPKSMSVVQFWSHISKPLHEEWSLWLRVTQNTKRKLSR